MQILSLTPAALGFSHLKSVCSNSCLPYSLLGILKILVQVPSSQAGVACPSLILWWWWWGPFHLPLKIRRKKLLRWSGETTLGLQPQMVICYSDSGCAPPQSHSEKSPAAMRGPSQALHLLDLFMFYGLCIMSVCFEMCGVCTCMQRPEVRTGYTSQWLATLFFLKIDLCIYVYIL